MPFLKQEFNVSFDLDDLIEGRISFLDVLFCHIMVEKLYLREDFTEEVFQLSLFGAISIDFTFSYQEGNSLPNIQILEIQKDSLVFAQTSDNSQVEYTYLCNLFDVLQNEKNK